MLSEIGKYQSLTEQTVEGQMLMYSSQFTERFQFASWPSVDMGFLIKVLAVDSTLWYVKEINSLSRSSQGQSLKKKKKNRKKGVYIVKNVPEGKLLWCQPWLLLPCVTTTNPDTGSRDQQLKSRALCIDNLWIYTWLWKAFYIFSL